MQYLPFLDGNYSVAPGLIPMQKATASRDKLVFQQDEAYAAYLANKDACRQEAIRKYFCEQQLPPETGAAVNKYIVQQFLLEYPGVFELKTTVDGYLLFNRKTGKQVAWGSDWVELKSDDYLSLFDALCCQAQEDFAICQVEEGCDRMAAIHLCAPNHWAASDKIGKPFDAVHAPVPGMEKAMPHYFKMLLSIIQKGPYTRFAWGIATDRRLNHHPQPPAGIDPAGWQGRTLDAQTSELYIRVERQNLIGFPLVNAFMFTIRTYFYPADEFDKDQKTALLKAVESMSPASLVYKGLNDKIELLRMRLR